MKFWEAMREMQENDKKVRCLRWDRRYEKHLYWKLGNDIDLPSGMDWEDVMCEWEIVDDLNKECVESGHVNTWMPKNQSLCLRCGVVT